MSLIDEVIKANQLNKPTVITQEFVVRVSVSSLNPDSTAIRNLLDGVAAKLDTVKFDAADGKVQVTNVYAK